MILSRPEHEQIAPVQTENLPTTPVRANAPLTTAEKKNSGVTNIDKVVEDKKNQLPSCPSPVPTPNL